MSNLITEIYDKQAVVDNLNQLGELINSSLNAIVASAPKLQSPIDYLTAVQSISEIEKKNTEVTQAKAKALSDLDKAYQQADKAMNQSIALEDEEYKEVTKLTNEYKEKAKEQKQLLELERTRQQTMQNGNKLLQMEAKSEGELRMQQQQLIKAQQSLRVTNAEENALREKLIAKINANKEALKGMSDEVSKQRDNIGNYKSALDGLANGAFPSVGAAMKQVRNELTQLEALQASGVQLTAEQKQRYNDLNLAMGQLADVQGDISARTKALANDYLGMNTALEGVKLGVNIMTSLQSVTALLGGENEELQKAMAKVVATQQILNTVTQIQKQLNKDSELMTGLVALKHKFLTTQIIAETKAQTALNVAKLGLVGAVTAAVGALGYMIVKMASAQNATADLSAELNKQASEAIGNDVAKITELKSQWDKLGGTMEEKRAYLEKYNSKLEELGLHFDNVNQLETFMNEHTKDYVDAITARAKADAARSILAEKTSEFVKNALDFERQNIQGQQTFWERFQRMVLDWQVGRTEASKMVREAYEVEQKDMQDQIDTTIELINKYQEEADKLFAGLPVKEKDKKKTKEQTQANKDLKLSLEELQEQEEEWVKTQLNDIFKNTTKNLTEQTEATAKLIEEKKKLREEVVNSIEIEEEEAEKVETLTEMTKRLAKEQADALKERTEAIQSAKENLTEAFTKITELQLDNLERESDAYDENYERRRQVIENTVMSEAEKDRRLKALDNEKTAHDKQVAKERAQIERRQAIFKNAIQSAEAMSNAVASVGLLLRKETEGDTYSAIARYIAAIAAGVSAVTTVASLISQLVRIPAFEKGGTAQANKPFIAGEKGREIGFGVYSGKVYDFSKPTIFKANEPINIKNANETKQIINNTNEYNKDVTLHNEVVVNVIDNKRVQKYFKIGGKA
ncbi:MAG: hypothetical protein II604_00715 [Bacteroidales bacterium]|nr:hypothetical protein [Bacteroidales bacterium]